VFVFVCVCVFVILLFDSAEIAIEKRAFNHTFDVILKARRAPYGHNQSQY
jgi:hypothetical protein